MDYRLFFYGADGHIVRAAVLDGKTDEAASAEARAFDHAGAAEVWCATRLVIRFEAGELVGLKD